MRPAAAGRDADDDAVTQRSAASLVFCNRDGHVMSAPPPPLETASSFLPSLLPSAVQQGRSSLPLLSVPDSYAIPLSPAPRRRRRGLIICHDEGYFELYQFRHHGDHNQSYGTNAVFGTKFSIISSVIMRGSKMTGIHPPILLSICSFAFAVCSRRIPSC